MNRLHELQCTKSIIRREETTRADVKISAAGSKRKFTLNDIFTCKPDAKHPRRLPLQDLKDCQPTILIGLEHAKLLVESHIHQGGDADPIASKTQLGWIVWGHSAPSIDVQTHPHLHHKRVNYHMPSRSDDRELQEMVKQYFMTKNIGVIPGNVALMGQKEKRAMD